MAIFPGSVATDAGLYVAVNNLSTLLTDNPLTIGATTVNVISTTGFPTAGAISIGAEIIFYTGITATSFTGCTRGADGTSAAAHALNDQVDHNVIAFHHNVLKDEIIALESFLSTHLGLATTVTAAEFERLSGVTSPIQTQLNGKEPTITVLTVAKGGTNSGAALSNNRIIRSLGGAIVEAAAITANRAVVSDADGIPTHSATTDSQLGSIALLTPDRVPYINGGGNFESSPISSAELAFLDNVTSNVQTQLDSMLPKDGSEPMTGDLDMDGNDLVDVASINNTAISGFRNRYSNGEFRFDQRNEGGGYTVNASSIRTLDMVFAEAPPAQGVFTVQRSGVTPADFLTCLRVDVTTADASVTAAENYDVRFCAEGNDVRDFFMGTAGAKTFTVSFWVRSSVTGTFGFRVGNSAFNRSYVGQYTINVANTYEKKTVTIPGDVTGTWETGTAAGIRFQFDMGSGSDLEGTANAWQAGNFLRTSTNVRLISTVSASWFITGFQLELGSQATAFEYLPENVALARIQRYIEKSYPQGTALGASATTDHVRLIGAKIGVNNVTLSHIPFKVTKRSSPSISVNVPGGGVSGSWTWITSAGAGTNRTTPVDVAGRSGFTLNQGINETEFIAQGHWLATAEV